MTNHEVGRVAHKHLGARPVSIHELKEGWFGTAFGLKMPDGDEFVLKIAPSPAIRLLRYERDLMKAEIEVTDLVRTMSRLPVPSLLAYDTSHDMLPHDFFIVTRLDGQPMSQVRDSMSDEARDQARSQVGAHLRELHEISGPQFGLFNGPPSQTWPEAVAGLFAWLQSDAEDLAVPGVQGAFKVAASLYDALEEVTRPRLIHWDLWDGNIFVRPESGEITGYIDFERAMWGDPLMEANFYEPSEALLHSYGERFQSKTCRTRRRLYTLYLSLVMVVESTFRKFTQEHEAGSRDFLERALADIELAASI